MVGRKVEGHVMTEMREHTGQIERGCPFPGMFLLWCSRPGEYPTTQVGKSRWTDHDRSPTTSNVATIATSRTLVIAGNPCERRNEAASVVMVEVIRTNSAPAVSSPAIRRRRGPSPAPCPGLEARAARR